MDTIDMLVKDRIIEIKDEKAIKELCPEKLRKKKWEKE
jgi:hypothetical protein